MYRATFYTPLFFLSRKRSLTQNVQTFLRLYFFLISFKCFDNLWKRDFLIFLLFKAILGQGIRKRRVSGRTKIIQRNKKFSQNPYLFFRSQETMRVLRREKSPGRIKWKCFDWAYWSSVFPMFLEDFQVFLKFFCVTLKFARSLFYT